MSDSNAISVSDVNLLSLEKRVEKITSILKKHTSAEKRIQSIYSELHDEDFAKTKSSTISLSAKNPKNDLAAIRREMQKLHGKNPTSDLYIPHLAQIAAIANGYVIHYPNK